MMGQVGKCYTVVVLMTTLVANLVLIRTATAEAPFPIGRSSAEEAARPNFGSASYARSDTTGYEFPDEEQSNTKKLIKDVAVWVVVAGFVAYFMIEVFLRGDTDQTPAPKQGKDIPPSGAIVIPQYELRSP